MKTGVNPPSDPFSGKNRQLIMRLLILILSLVLISFGYVLFLRK
jgi:hypothetical protein